jgi:hypothetical protein
MDYEVTFRRSDRTDRVAKIICIGRCLYGNANHRLAKGDRDRKDYLKNFRLTIACLTTPKQLLEPLQALF